MNTLRSRIIRTAAASALVVPAIVGLTSTVGAAPAQASGEKCYPQTKTFPTPGDNTSLRVDVCVNGSGSQRWAYFKATWQDGGNSATDGHRKFDKLRLNARLEQYNHVYEQGSCSIAGDVNRNGVGERWCNTPTHKIGSSGGWTADGIVTYDLDRDGKGLKTWQLTGSYAT